MRHLRLENRELRVVCLPELGGKLLSILHKHSHLEVLWRRPGVPPHAVAPGACYDEHWCGGWDELFPNDEPARVDGLHLPDHGEVWSTAFEAREEEGAIELTATLPASGVHFTKRIALSGEAPHLEIEYRLRNPRNQDLPCLFKLHPALALSPGCRVAIPARRVRLEPECRGSLAGAPGTFDWPYAPLADGRKLDLRKLPARDSGELRFFYGLDLTSGWCALEHPAHGLAVTLSFSPEVFRTCWLFGSFGAWRDCHVAVLEPSTGYPFHLEEAMVRGTAGMLAAGAELRTKVTLEVGAIC